MYFAHYHIKPQTNNQIPRTFFTKVHAKAPNQRRSYHPTVIITVPRYRTHPSLGIIRAVVRPLLEQILQDQPQRAESGGFGLAIRWQQACVGTGVRWLGCVAWVRTGAGAGGCGYDTPYRRPIRNDDWWPGPEADVAYEMLLPTFLRWAKYCTAMPYGNEHSSLWIQRCWIGHFMLLFVRGRYWV